MLKWEPNSQLLIYTTTLQVHSAWIEAVICVKQKQVWATFNLKVADFFW